MSLITNPSQLAPPPARKPTPLGDVPGLYDNNGEHAKLFAKKLTAYEFGEYEASLVDEDGNTTKKSRRHHQMKFLGKTVCDPGGNLLWQTDEAAIAQLGPYDNDIVARLFVKVVAVNAAATEGAVDRAEKNSGPIPSDSTNGISPSTSESPTLVS